MNIISRIVKNKRGIGLSTVLGVVIFTTVVAVTVFTVVHNQSNNVARQIYNSEEYQSAVIAVNTTARLLKNRTDINASNFNTIVDSVATYVHASEWGKDVQIIKDSEKYVVTIRHSVANGARVVTSYLSPAAGIIGGALPVTYEEQTDIYSYLPAINPTTETEYAAVANNLSGSYLDYYLNTFTDTDPTTVSTGTQSISSVVESIISAAPSDSSFIQYSPAVTTISYTASKISFTHITHRVSSNTTLSSTQPQYVNGNLNIASGITLTVPKGQTLFVNGNLVLDSSAVFSGNVFVKGNVVVRGNNAQLFATIYMGGFFFTENNLQLGSVARPTFLFSNSYVEMGNVSDIGVVYIFAKEFIYNGGNPSLSGDIHVFSYDTKNLDFTSSAEMEPYNLMLIFEDFLNYGFPVLVGENGGFDTTPAG